MKRFAISLVVGLLMAEAGAYKLYQQHLHALQDNESEEIDADDQDINDGELNDPSDLVTYQQEVLTNGKNVRTLNKVIKAQKKHEDEEVDDAVDDFSGNYQMAQASRESTFYKAPAHPQPHPVKYIYATTDAEARKKEKELEIEPRDI